MSKRKRERLDLGRNNELKKLKPYKKHERGAKLVEKEERSLGPGVDDGGVVAGAINDGFESKPAKKTDKPERMKVKVDHDTNALQQNVLISDGTSQPLALARAGSIMHDNKGSRKLARRVAKMERRKNRKMETGEHPEDREVTLSYSTNGRQKRWHAKIENSLWRVSDPMGGQMLDLDPIFALNEE
jgi:hypothetical protein